MAQSIAIFEALSRKYPYGGLTVHIGRSFGCYSLKHSLPAHIPPHGDVVYGRPLTLMSHLKRGMKRTLLEICIRNDEKRHTDDYHNNRQTQEKNGEITVAPF